MYSYSNQALGRNRVWTCDTVHEDKQTLIINHDTGIKAVQELFGILQHIIIETVTPHSFLRAL